jgi:hypothetical protein
VHRPVVGEYPVRVLPAEHDHDRRIAVLAAQQPYALGGQRRAAAAGGFPLDAQSRLGARHTTILAVIVARVSC